jgi:hypothetical protein
MRYPACLFIVCALVASSAQAASDGAPANSLVAAQPAQTAATASTPAAAPSPAPAADPNKPVPVTAPVDLFNGKDLSGWSYFTGGQPADVSSVCSVKDGVMVVVGKPIGYLRADHIRENYQLHFEWRWTNSDPKTNSGALLNISPGSLQMPGSWPVSFQYQTKNTHAGDIISMSTAACAEAPAGKTASRQKDASEKPVGEWNTGDIIVSGDTIECIVNGVTQNKVTKCEPHSGYIGFQLEGYSYEMRNIKLSPLPAKAP